MARTLVLLLALALLSGLVWLLVRGGEGELSGVETPGIDEQGDPRAPAEVPAADRIDRAPEQRAPIPAATASNSLEVHLFDRSGTPLVDVPVELEVRSRETESGAMVVLGEGRTEDGTCRIEDLASDAPFVVAARAEPPWLPGRLRLDPPIDFTEPARVVLGFDGLIVVGRALGPDHSPLADVELRCEVAIVQDGGATSDPELQLRTDTSSRFVWRVAGGLAGLSQRIFRTRDRGAPERHLIDIRHEGTGGRLSSGWIELPIAPDLEVHDMGEVQLELLPLVAAGRVVDTEGRRIGGAMVWIRAPANCFRWRDSLSPYQPEGPMVAHRGVLAETTDADGKFLLRGRIPETAIEVGVSKESYYQPAPLPCYPGDSGLVVVLERGAMLEGSFRDFSHHQRTSIYLILSEPGGEFATSSFESVHGRADMVQIVSGWASSGGYSPSYRTPDTPCCFYPHPDGTFRFGPLPPGTYALRARFVQEEEPFLEVGGLELRAGETNRDPRLQDLTLAELLTGLELRVVDDTGRRVTGGYVLVDREGSATTLVDLGKDPLLLPDEDLPLHLVIRARGFAEITLEEVWEDQEVVLEPGRPVRFQLPTSLVIPEGWRLGIGWDDDRVDLDRSYGWGTPLLAWFDEAGSAELIAPGTGRVPVSLYAEKSVEGGGQLAGLDLPGRENWVEVRDVSGTQLIELPLGADQLEGLPD